MVHRRAAAAHIQIFFDSAIVSTRWDEAADCRDQRGGTEEEEDGVGDLVGYREGDPRDQCNREGYPGGEPEDDVGDEVVDECEEEAHDTVLEVRREACPHSPGPFGPQEPSYDAVEALHEGGGDQDGE